jgi:hypothetical protein
MNFFNPMIDQTIIKIINFKLKEETAIKKYFLIMKIYFENI